MLAPEAIITTVTALATAIAQGRDNDEIALLGTVFSQLGDTLATLSAAKDIIKNKTENTAATKDKKEGENSAEQNTA